ncbi:MAG TPA: type I restriction enzyme HsdR N-terminal domain-containing protein [Chitinophagales bacterium]|nr:type I restriction enzyme HsdR N-terminal domain-containing protein [Chitinophagales bacterium]
MSTTFFKTKIIDNKKLIFDPIRKKYIVLTPEEEVRQNILAYLVEHKNYPITYIAVEKQIKVSGKNRRFDIVVYDKEFVPIVLIECKQPEVPLTQKTMEQATMYNLTLKVPFLIITNGKQHFVVKVNLESGEYEFLQEVPILF